MLLVVDNDSATRPPATARGRPGRERPATDGPRRVLVVDDEESLRHLLQLLLRKEGYEAVGVASADAALQALDRERYEIVITDLRMPGRSGLELVDEIRARGLAATIVVMTAYGSRDVAIEAMKRGAYDYLSKPFEADELILLLRKAEERERLFRENTTLRNKLGEKSDDDGSLGGMIARSAVMREVFRTIRKIADFKTTVLIQGESGTGKELVARAIHGLSSRASRPFVAVNCGAIPDRLLESELFGHVRGAFTDAVRDRAGLFVQADGGTLLLDEIGELPLELQVKLLRVLQEGEVRPLGSARGIAVDVRVLAATARDLEAGVAQGTFREDLFYRLNVMSVMLPALRERSEDIPLLVQHFIARLNERMGLAVTEVTPEALRLLLDSPWPGNVRELENRIERALVLCEGNSIGLPEVSPRVGATTGEISAVRGSEDLSMREAMRRAESDLIRRALARSGGNRTQAAQMLDISYRTLLYKIKEHAISRDELNPEAAADGEDPAVARDFKGGRVQ